MAGWYVRRGEKIIGPLELPKLRELVSKEQLFPSDQLAEDIAGPWKEAGGTALFDASKPAGDLEPAGGAARAEQNRPLVARRESLPAVVERPSPARQVARAGGVVLVVLGKGTIAVLGAISRSLASRSQRRHELKLEKIRAQALVDAERARQPPPPPAPAPTPPPTPVRPLRPVPPSTIVVSPKVVQTTIVRPPLRSYDGCVGWVVALLLIVIGLIAAYIMGGIEALRPLIQ